MKILFIQDNAINESLALTELSALLKAEGYECELFIEREERNILNKIKQYNPDTIIFPFGIFGDEYALRLSKKIKNMCSTPIVFAGPHPTFYPEIINHSYVDIICRGEAEYPILELVKTLENNKEIKRIKGVWIKKGRKIHKNSLGQLIKDLDSLPLPDRELYYKYKFIRDLPMKRFMSGRGCIHSCGYCFNPTLRAEYNLHNKRIYTRKKSPDRMIEEIKDIKIKHPLNSIHFSDDLFTFNKKWVIEFCKIYKKEIDLPFTFNTSAEQINKDIIKNVAKAGCSGIAIGIETGNEALRQIILNKKISNRQIIDASRLIKEYGIKLATFNMLANPGETIKDAFLTMKLNQKLKVDNPRVTISHPIPGTKLYDYGIKNNFFDKETSKQKNKSYTKPFYKSSNINEFENLFYFFRIGCKYPRLTAFIKKIIRLPKNKIFEFLSILSSLEEKKFFKIPLFSGIKYYLHSGNPYLRTTNYTSII